MTQRAPAELWTAAVAAGSDRYTIDERGIPSRLLMERAALCVSHEVVARWRALPAPSVGTPPAAGRAVGVLVGPGNNGADGLAVARQLHGWGVPVAAWMVTRRHNAAVGEQRSLAAAYGVPIFEGLPDDREASRGWVDGLLGTGSRGPLRGAVADAVAWMARHRPECVAIDVPTGVDPDDGGVSSDAVRAACTVTFARSKPGLHVTPGRRYAGQVVVADIGLLPPPDADAGIGLLDPAGLGAALAGWFEGAHKGQRGHVGVLGGSPGTTGAALLAGVAALRAGAGLVTVASPDPGVRAALPIARPELMTAPVPDDVASVLPTADALVVGPGLTDARTHGGLEALYRDDPRPALWDASALVRVPLEGERSAGARVLTPHPGEAARLLHRLEPSAGWNSARVQSARVAVARRLAAAAAAVVVLKGEGSVLASPEGAVAVAVSGGPALATAGSGDVLSGLGGALLARGRAAWWSATAAVHVHGVAGEGLATGAVALDIAEALPAAMGQLARATTHARWPRLRRG